MVNVTCYCIKSGYKWEVALDENSHMPSCPIHRKKSCIRIQNGGADKKGILENGIVKSKKEYLDGYRV